MIFLLKKYKLAINFILTFLMVYIIATFCYHIYLHLSETSSYFPDYITNLVGLQTREILTAFGYNIQIIPSDTEPSLKLIINDMYLVRIIEGCNAISVVILFISFVIAFSSNFKTTVFYVLFGTVIIYVANLFRISLLTVLIYKYPEYTRFFHDIMFPLIIYGIVLFLWVFWVNYFAIKKEKK